MSYYKLVPTLMAFVLILSCKNAPNRDCSHFKTGQFAFSTVVDGDTLETTFTRTETMEIDFFNGKRDTSNVRWINDCEYILKKRHPKNRQEEKSIHIKILTTTDSSYTFEFSAVGETKKLRGTVYKTN